MHVVYSVSVAFIPYKTERSLRARLVCALVIARSPAPRIH